MDRAPDCVVVHRAELEGLHRDIARAWRVGFFAGAAAALFVVAIVQTAT